MFEKIYNIGINVSNEDFYTKLEIFSDEIFTKAFILFDSTADKFNKFEKKQNQNIIRDKNEYILEIVLLGVLYNSYFANSLAMNKAIGYAARSLYSIRRNSPEMKPYADYFRGILASKFLINKSKKFIPVNKKHFDKFLLWLESTGEFREEAARLRVWQQFLNYYSDKEFFTFIENVSNFAEIFTLDAKTSLGEFTSNVALFLKSQKSTYKDREDIIFTGRNESEYHVNMFGSCILNKTYRQAFINAPNKIVLLPTCMRNEESCKAQAEGDFLRCTACKKECNINITAKEIDGIAEVYLIPHSSDFTKFLKKWENNSDTALVGTACTLNLLSGGYEMRNLNIKSQCILLDFPGCKKHWDNNGMPTSVNIKRLKEILEPNLINI